MTSSSSAERDAQAALAASERHLALTSRAGRIGLWDLDLTTNTSWRSARHDEIFGYDEPPSEWSHADFLRHVVADDRGFVEKAFDAAYAAGSLHFHCRIAPRGRSITWIEVYGEIVRDRAGRPIRITGTVVDVNAWHEADEDLRATRRRLHAVFENTHDAILVVDDDARYIDVNPAGCALMGRTREELVGATVFDVTPAEQREAARELWKRFQADGYQALDYELERPDASRVFVEYRAQARILPGMHMAVMRDVTAHRQALKALAEQKDELQTILRTALDGFWVVGLEGNLLDANDAACAMLGYEREELLHLLVSDLDALGRAGTEDHLRKAAREGKDRFESRLRRKDGRVIDVEISLRFLAVPGRAGRLVAFVRDITAHRLAEEQLRQSQKMQAVGQLAGGVAHDFNNLLTIILVGCGFALRETPAESRVREELEAIRMAARKARSLIEQLLAFSRGQRLQPRVVDLDELVLGTERMLTLLLGDSVVLRTELAPSLGAIYADPTQIQQVLMNLAINAVDAMPEGGTLTIRTSVSDSGSQVLLSVEDTGVGMDDRTRERIFEPFFTTKPVGKGTGLGLSTVFGIVQQSNGTIHVTSEPGRGTRFDILFPRLSEPIREGSDSSTASAATPSGAGDTVLVVEDEEQVRWVTVRALIRAGFDVISAGSMDEALQKSKEHPRPPRLLLTDVRMPGLSGPEVSAELTARIPGLRTVYMSGFSDDDLEARAPSVFFVQKPFTAESLVRKLREALDS